MRTPVTSLPALNCFRAAAEHLSFSKAADQLNLTHSAVSRAVRLLEQDIGTALFERRNRAVFLTDAGRELAQATQQGLGIIEAAVSRLKVDHEHAPVTISCEPTLLMRWLIPRIPLFQKACPNADIRLIAGGGPVTLGSGIDFAIRRDDFDWPENYNAQLLFTESIGPVCRPDKVSSFFEGCKIQSDAPLLHTRTRPTAWSTWCKLNSTTHDNNPAHNFEHFYFSLQAAVAGLGVAIGPWHLVRDDISAGLLSAPSGFVADGSGYYLLSSSNHADSHDSLAFRNWLTDFNDQPKQQIIPEVEMF
ncbi:LysR family transcriptional regulator [Ochrobactrum sp. SFR4]|uniref:LysR family transcriptional regulator n=1 Tax=Ochrobactrum sp. SFR4 TaxID=2717368 RepID=UPI000EFC08B5|nr:LysR family transcriptional regulator [Ochrobactrum sp. SFR4]MBX8827211.1 LysR family transcriptional regulator [Ochrobactrum sp. SFR4]